LEAGISNLAFGISYGNGTAFNQTLINDNQNLTAILALDFRGLGLNNVSYAAFSGMLQLISKFKHQKIMLLLSSHMARAWPLSLVLRSQICGTTALM
jgi:hypothetical protein